MDEERLYAQIHEALGSATAGPDFKSRVLRSIREAAEAEARAIRAMEMRRSGSVAVNAGSSVSTRGPVDVVVADRTVKAFAGLEPLTPRQVAVLRLVARGMTNAQIAGELFVSQRTVHAHLRDIFRRLNVQKRSSATLWAVKHGL